MESWEGLNYYTRDNSKWAPLLNLSTAEWNIGWLPSNVVAIPGSLNSSWDFPPGTLVIENADIDTLGDRTISPIVFGIASGIVILWAILWIGYSVWRGSIFKAHSDTHDTLPTHNGTSQDTNATQVNNGADIDDGFMTADEFRRQLYNFYYEPIATELELHEKDLRIERLAGEDVEEVTDLLRKMYDLDLRLWSLQNSLRVTEEDREALRAKSDAILARVREIVASWTTANENTMSWNEKEVTYLNEIVHILKNRIAPQRYKHPNHPPA